jgi:uncharacterized membrane protein
MATITEQKKETTIQSTRIQSVDILRGAVIVLMAIDHVRCYSGISPGGPDPAVFFTRWVTHFCAPAFVFFAGTSAFLYGNKINNKSQLARFLLTRGFLLVLLELTLIRFLWSFNVSSDFILAGVIWVIGWCMVLMAALIWLRPAVVGFTGLAIIVFQQVLRLIPNLMSDPVKQVIGPYWNFIYPSGVEGWENIQILYVLVPWIGVMAAGYGFGLILLKETKIRRKLCLRIGLGATGLFLAVGTVAALATAQPDSPPFIFRLLNQMKYPASQLFLLMTLGPVVALVPWTEKVKGWVADVLSTFGKVPMFYYLMHIIVIHLTAIGVMTIMGVTGYPEWYANAPYVWMPDEFKWSLGLLYLVFFVDVVILYFFCRWYSKFKTENPDVKVLKYI